MNQAQKLSSFIITSTIAVGILIWLALPYPWTPLGQWIESFVRDTNYCTCFWPWWLFIAASIILTLIAIKIYKYLNLDKAWLWTTASIINILMVIYHSLARTHFLSQRICEDSVFSSWVWLIILLVTFISVFISHHPTKHSK